MTRVFLLITLFTLTSLVQIVTGQSAAKDVGKDEVILYVTAADRHGRSVGGLKTEHFKIREGKEPQSITAFSFADAPISVGILVDVSGSTEGYLKAEFDAMAHFIEESAPDTEFFVMTFNTKQELLVDWTRTGDDVLKKLGTITIAPKSNTALFDAMDAALTKISGGTHRRKALVMFGDGIDNASKNSYGEIKSKWRRSDVQLYTLNFRSPADASSQMAEQADSRMDELTGLTGGRATYVASWTELNEQAARTAVELRSQYRIAYQPTIDVGNRKYDIWREIDVSVDLPPDLASGVGKVKARTRRGYYLVQSATK
jgi:Ca-activated chloride channel family protein